MNLPLKTSLLLPSLLLTQSGSFLECPALLLLFSLLLLPLGLPVMGALPHLICDSRVLERYILEAREAENATVRPPSWDKSTEVRPRGTARSGNLDSFLALGSGVEVGSQSPQ